MTPADAIRRAIADAETLASNLRAALAALEGQPGAAPLAREADGDSEVVGVKAAAYYLDETYEAVRSAVRSKRLPSRVDLTLGRRIIFRVADLEERRVSRALVNEAARLVRPVQTDRDRSRPVHSLASMGHDVETSTPA